MIKCLLTEFRSDQTGKYLALGPLRHDLGPNIFRPSHSVNKYIARDLAREMRKKTTKLIPEFTFFFKEEKLEWLKGSYPCIAHLGLLLHLTHSYRLQCLTIFYRSDLEKHFIEKLNAKRFFKNILKNSKKWKAFRRYSTPLSSQDGNSSNKNV